MKKDPAGFTGPFISADASVAEVTAQSFLLGLLLSVVFAAANIYLGLYAGLTVSASIPAAVLSIGILKGLFRRGTILENNIVQTLADSGETMAAGVIFTVPALLLTGIWKDVEFWPTVLIAVLGSLLGSLFMIPLRRAHIVEDPALTYPEGIACAQVLIAGEKESSGTKYLLASMGIGAAFKFLTGGWEILKGSLSAVFPLGRTAFFVGGDVSPALLGLGYIIGFNISAVVFLGACITWLVAVPVHGAMYGVIYSVGGDASNWFWETWKSEARYLGVGAMLVGGVHSIFKVRSAVTSGAREAWTALRVGGEKILVRRTEEEISVRTLVPLLAVVILATFGLSYYLIGSLTVSLISVVIAVILSAFFSAVGSYLCGLIGGSNMPISGMTICSVILTGGVLLLAGVSGTQGIVATLVVAALVCCASSGAGDMAQNLKTGYVVGATPKKQMWMNIVGGIVPALAIAPVLVVLHHGYGIGTGAPGALKAPQAALFASLAEGLFGEGRIAWTQVFVGAGIGLAVIFFDRLLQARRNSFRLPVMGIAIGMYLPITTSLPIFFGGMVAHFAKNQSETGSGVLFSSGLIAGEAIVGVILGGFVYLFQTELPVPYAQFAWPTLVAGAALTGLLYKVSKKTS